MPELPDVTVYVEHLRALTVGRTIERVRLASPFVLRTVTPSPRDLEGKLVRGITRLGKRVVFELEDELFIVLHMMVAGRFRWLDPGAKIPAKLGLFAFDFDNGALVMTEASKKKRASMHLCRGTDALAAFDRGGLELEGATLENFIGAMTRTPHTLKRSLTDPTILSGIGNAYSDEILFEAGLSPLRLTTQLDDDAWRRLFEACHSVLGAWTDRLRREASGKFPEGVTAFREGMSVHGRYAKPCPRCAAPVQRITYADNETNYCAPCQTGGKLLADRSLSRLLGKDWPKTLEELEERRPAAKLSPNPKRSTRTPKKA